MPSRLPQPQQVTVQDTAIREKLRKIEALFAGAATPGERDTAEAAERG